MGNSTNRALQRNHIKAKAQRVQLGQIEALKPCYRSDKCTLRTLAETSVLMVKPITREGNVPDRTFVLYNPSIYRAPKPAAWAAYVDCGDELVKVYR